MQDIVELERIDPKLLVPSPYNARQHSRRQRRQLGHSIKAFGFTAPVIIDENNQILAGHGRTEVAIELGLERIPCVRVLHLTETQKRAYTLADNKLALNATWDEIVLASELVVLGQDDPVLLEMTGFSVVEIDDLTSLNVPDEDEPEADVLPDARRTRQRCKPGDLWKLGPHLLACGDARDPDLIALLMGGELARMVFTDPPYNVPIAGNVGGLGRIKHPEFAMASGEMTDMQFITFLRAAFNTLVRSSVDGSIHYICMDWRHMSQLLAAGDVYTELKNLVVWTKDNGGMGTFYRSGHELVFVFKNGTAEHINSFELGQYGRYRTNVWPYRGMNSMAAGRQDELALHPTVKPVAMIADAIKDVSQRGEIILDIFGGSGSTLIAAEKTGRRARLVEIDPVYCDRILTRWENYAHDDAERLVDTAGTQGV